MVEAFSYATAPHPMRPDLAEAHRAAWQWIFDRLHLALGLPLEPLPAPEPAELRSAT